MAEQINPIGRGVNIAQILGEDFLAQATPGVSGQASAVPGGQMELPRNMFEDVLAKAIDALEGVSRQEMYANELIQKYVRGEVEMHEVMLAQSKASIMVQLAVTTINAAVTSFKEVTQMQV
ncbi:MAG: flagellar hook-basal body complex protein FliE [Candidatus Saganbacteria bacterium]|nr:flagellar hook-basal body complex protein FliE [Candidatus Saganbacteria bacterium]